jgi:hypothetical protein
MISNQYSVFSDKCAGKSNQTLDSSIYAHHSKVAGVERRASACCSSTIPFPGRALNGVWKHNVSRSVQQFENI